jgi:hypothetical protein
MTQTHHPGSVAERIAVSPADTAPGDEEILLTRLDAARRTAGAGRASGALRALA